MDNESKKKTPAVCGRHRYCQSYPLNAIIEISKAAGREVQLENLLKVIIDKTSELMDADRCTIFICDETANELWSYVAIGIDMDEIRFPLGAGIAGDVALTRKTANVPDAYEDTRFNAEFDTRTGYRTKSLLCCPMVNVEGRLIGVLQAINKNTGSQFDEDDETLIEYLAGYSAIAIERAFLTDRYVEYKKNQQIMDLAREIQMNMLPVDFSSICGNSDAEVYAFISAAADVGGDFYDFFFIRENVLCFAIGDVSGKGVPAALFMAVAKTLFSSIAREGASPGQILHRLNQELSRANEMMMFVTIFVGILDTVSGAFIYSNGGHNSPYILNCDGTIETLAAAAGPAVGLMNTAHYTEDMATLKRDSIMFLYTDGIDEAKDKTGRMFTVPRLEDVLRNIAADSLQGVSDKVLSEVAGFTAGAPQSDDITILSVRLNGGLSKGRTYVTSVECEIKSIPVILNILGEVLQDQGYDNHFSFDVKVAVDEACTNIINYSCTGNGKIEISIENNNRAFIVAIKYPGQRFAPDDASTPDIDSPLEQRRIGGLGIFFMKQLMNKIDYVHTNGVNVLTMTKYSEVKNP
ncbi:MAG: SpoIIE family protein phosphatase [Nitrospirae bacterium]|nr:SpoIIE family protein phosphatase [Nitrospirota bacterium]